MRLHHELTVAAPLARAWEVFEDASRLGSCLPSTSSRSTRRDGLYRGRMEVGAVAYDGSLRLVEVDEDASTTVMSMKAHEVGGRGTAAATIATSLHADGDAATRIEVEADLLVKGHDEEPPAKAVDAAVERMLADIGSAMAASIAAAPPASADQGIGGAAASPTAAGRSAPLGAAASPAADVSLRGRARSSRRFIPAFAAAAALAVAVGVVHRRRR